VIRASRFRNRVSRGISLPPPPLPPPPLSTRGLLASLYASSDCRISIEMNGSIADAEIPRDSVDLHKETLSLSLSVCLSVSLFLSRSRGLCRSIFLSDDPAAIRANHSLVIVPNRWNRRVIDRAAERPQSRATSRSDEAG